MIFPVFLLIAIVLGFGGAYLVALLPSVLGVGLSNRTRIKVSAASVLLALLVAFGYDLELSGGALSMPGQLLILSGLASALVTTMVWVTIAWSR